MGSAVIEATSLWQRTLALQTDDVHAELRDQLRTAFWHMRENVLPFVSSIHRDVLGLTVHDETHLDALWQIADIIAGPEFEINPIEAFVFGASVLLHDTAMSISAYKGGLSEIRDLQVWKDIEAQYGSEDQNKIQFLVLRELHAQQAEELAKISFTREGKQEALYLLSDVRLRDALGQMIGRIAHSHHWSHRDLIENLNSRSGGVPGHPKDWVIDELKVACLLRCADAAHIDARRAPSFLYAISEISGVSNDHWNFQNKLNQPTVEGGRLLFTSGSDFGLSEARAWWLCHDVLKMIDGELTASNAILADEAGIEFSVNGVKGIDSPKLLSKNIRVKGWTPVSAEVRVSDPVHLAKTLGGQNLYGNSPIPPIRELLQNAVDAIRARRVIESRPSDWGRIRVTIEQKSGDKIVLHVDDQGVGMSERVLTGPLIDFGSTFWGSDLARHEFPGLISRRPMTIGQFGIGFFAVFLLGDEVTVFSRKYDEGREGENALVFDSLSRRPLLRRAVTGELPRDYSCRVSVVLNSDSVEQLTGSDGVARTKFDDRFFVKDAIKRLVCALDVKVEFKNAVTGDEWIHNADWVESRAEVFLDEIGSELHSEEVEDLAQRMRVIRDLEGRPVGRAAFRFSDGAYAKSYPLISVGGFTNYTPERPGMLFARSESRANLHIPTMIGVVEGTTSDAVRHVASPKIEPEALAIWATEQAALIHTDRHLDSDQIVANVQLMKAGSTYSDLPFALSGGEFVTWPDVVSLIGNHSSIHVALKKRDYSEDIKFCSMNDLGPILTSKKACKNILVLDLGGIDIPGFADDEFRDIVEAGVHEITTFEKQQIIEIFELKRIHDVCLKEWGDLTMRLQIVNLLSDNVISKPRNRWVLSFLSSVGN